MWTAWGKRKLRPVVGRNLRYHQRKLPETAATAHSASSVFMNLGRILPPLGD
jgi:hypothetical protein